MSHRPLVFVSGLTVGDYLLWNWSLNGNHVVLALVSGLSLVPLAVVCVLLLAVSVARVIASSARLPARLSRLAGEPQGRAAPRAPASGGGPAREPSSSTTSADGPSRKLAA